MDFSLTCIDNGNGLPLELSLCCPFTKEELHDSLRSESWEDLDQNTYIACYRQRCTDISCTKLQQIIQYLGSDTVKAVLSEIVVSHNLDISLNEINEYGKLYVSLTKDKPGYHVGKHYDPDRVWLSAMIYLNQELDSNRATEFYANEHDNIPIYISSTEFSKGWAIPEKIWHAGKNNTNDDRYSILIWLYNSSQEENNIGAHLQRT